MSASNVQLIECPRDAMQGIHPFIPTEVKVKYIQSLLNVGFDTLDFGSFVSPKAIPQMADTTSVLAQLDFSKTNSKLLAIIGNTRGAQAASEYKEIQYLGFPFSISDTFLQRNINSSIEESFERLKRIQDIALANDKDVVAYISMAFGNPYGDPWDAEVLMEWSEKLKDIGVGIISLSDTIGVCRPAIIDYLFSALIPSLPEVTFGAHLHTTPDTWLEKVEAAYKAGCRRFDGALKGFGGCPMAKDDLTGNMPTENMVSYFNAQQINSGVDHDALMESIAMVPEVFP